MQKARIAAGLLSCLLSCRILTLPAAICAAAEAEGYAGAAAIIARSATIVAVRARGVVAIAVGVRPVMAVAPVVMAVVKPHQCPWRWRALMSVED